MWPFNKKLSIKFVDVKPTLAQEKERLKNEAALHALRESNKNFINEYVKDFIAKEVEYFKQHNPQPFQPGESVLIDAYRTNPSSGWLSSGRSFIDTFKAHDSNISLSTSYRIAKVFVETGWLEEKLSTNWSTRIISMLEYSNTTHITNSLRDFINQLRHPYGTDKIRSLVEWAVDFDWDYHKFKYEPAQGSYLILKWGGFPASNMISEGTELAAAQSELINLEKEVDIARQRVKEAQDKFDIIKKVHADKIF